MLFFILLFIAIEGGKIIAEDKIVSNVIKELKKLNKDPNVIIIEYVTPKGSAIII